MVYHEALTVISIRLELGGEAVLVGIGVKRIVVTESVLSKHHRIGSLLGSLHTLSEMIGLRQSPVGLLDCTAFSI